MREERVNEERWREAAEMSEVEEETDDSESEDENLYKYSREETIAAVSGYYTFLTQMYMEESYVVYPPPGGWPEIVNADPVALQSLGKSDEVLALLAHLPYIRGSWGNAAEIGPASEAANWPNLIKGLSDPLPPGDTFTHARSARLFTEGGFHEISPPQVVGLTTSRDEAMVLDTKHGVIHWEDCPNRINYGGHCKVNVDWSELDDGVPEEEMHWRYGATAWTIPDFFEVLKDQYIQLEWLPISQLTVREGPEVEYPGDYDEKGMKTMLQGIYREHGWPDLAVYRKSDCLKAVEKAMAERYPDSVCYRSLE